MAEEVRMLDVALIDPSPYQPRARFDEGALTELAASIREHGVLQPILVRPAGARFELIAGERRLRAVKQLGQAQVPAIVRRYGEEQALEAALIENIQREDISVVETARAYERLANEFHYHHGEIALRTGKSRTAVANTLRLLHLPEAVLEALDRGELTEGHARALLTLPYPSLQVEVAEWVIRNAVPVRELEQRVKVLAAGEDRPSRIKKAHSPGDPEIAVLEERLRGQFATRAAIQYRNGRGSISLEFYSDDDLNRLLELLGLS